ncbi:Thiol-disulfide oxidoreductase ResA [Caulifigura coniformis]|uniref:Thiol-disulfide oxidoreductase ResA n=1 Tax=Caulifigura coniformis TaxID=2527983 RepID=A0A517SGH8_9PLAN|nr:TlpA disulfide reductase family protein [Caulifigura coniformis]QDT55236.1 Thiol-disulfide oxidoreductase ResA [Caulifigura coniformis]
MSRFATRSFTGLVVAAAAATASAQQAATGVDAAAMLKYKPSRPKVDFEMPAAADIAKCRVDTEQRGKSTGYVLYGPQGQVLRRFVDADARGTINEFRYYDSGMEVYREADTNGDSKADLFRWLGPGGMRWAIDSDADLKIDRWQQISAEEATLEAIRAMAAGDAATLKSLMVSADDIRTLGISPKVGERLLAQSKDIPGAMRQAMTGSKTLTAATEWERFDCSMRVPSCLAASSGKWDKDQLVYENVMAMVRTGQETGFVQIGEMVKVGDTWKLTRIPRPIDGDNLQVEGGILMQESLDGASGGAAEGLSPEAQKLVEQLKVLDDTRPAENASKDTIEKYNIARADLITRLAKASTSESEKVLWWKQLVEGVAANTQMGVFPNGVERLAAIEKDIEATGLTDLIPFTKFRVLLVTFAEKMKAATDAAARQKVQEAHLQDLSDFVKEYSKSEEAPEAIWQVATTVEFNGNAAAATDWYKIASSRYASSPAGIRSKGALNRLDLKGKELALSGPSLDGKGVVNVASMKGKVVAVVFWATWFKPSVDETPQLVELYKQYNRQGFEIVGLNLDPEGTPVSNFLRDQTAAWPQILDPGGMENGKAAREFGIIAPGTMFLVGKDGKVISNSASMEDLKKLLPELLAGK